jgi:hypothetical protein
VGASPLWDNEEILEIGDHMKALPRISPALVVASVALVVALGGTTYAAISLPARSVGTPQLKPDAVTSPKVKNGTLKRIDFAAGEVPDGPRGAQGPAGRKGDTGATGAAGAAGPQGPSSGYVDTNDGPINVGTSGDTRLATLAIPQPGKYVIWAKVWLIRPMAGQATSGACRLVADGLEDVQWWSAPTGLGAGVANLITREFTQAGTINYYCNASGASTAYQAKIAAIQVASLTASLG